MVNVGPDQYNRVYLLFAAQLACQLDKECDREVGLTSELDVKDAEQKLLLIRTLTRDAEMGPFMEATNPGTGKDRNKKWVDFYLRYVGTGKD